ncbi:MAG: diguanylate cyclase [Mariprofundus sp.]|nr:diguanylate cyclase [Mariprofundus sp.]
MSDAIADKIDWHHKLTIRFQITLFLVLFATFAVSQYHLFSKTKASIYQEEVERAAFMADGLSRSLQTLMLSGEASYATDWLNRITGSPELLTAQVIRKDQTEAFLDGKTMHAVNEQLGSDFFSRPLKPSYKIKDLDANAFSMAIDGKQSSIMDEANAQLTFLLPIKAHEACMSCHAYDPSKVRGVLRITTSTSRAQQRIDEARKDTIISGVSVALVIGLLLFFFIRRQILIPLESLTLATSTIASGDLENRVVMKNSTEIGKLCNAFNHMVDALQSSTVSKEYFETIMSSMGEMLFVTDSQHIIQLTNPATFLTLGYSLQELQGRHLETFIADGIELTSEEEKQLSKHGEVKSIERKFIHKSGEQIPVLLTINTMQDNNGSHGQIIHAGRDITRQKRVEGELRLAAKVMESDSNAIMICDQDANIVLVNPAFCEITGFNQQEVIGKNPRILSSGRQSKEYYSKLWSALIEKGVWSGEIWNRRKNGGIYPERLSITAVRNEQGKITNFVSIFNDITDQKNIEQKLSHLAHHDQLTGLPNRVLFNDRLLHALAHAGRNKTKIGLMFIDIDGFKAINDNFGHDVGDALLCVIGDSLTELVRDADTVARIGGDEFVIIIENLSDLQNMVQVAGKILQRFSKPTMAAETVCDIGCSIGIAVSPDDSKNSEELLKMADTAMYLAKTSGKQQYRIYSKDCT